MKRKRKRNRTSRPRRLARTGNGTSNFQWIYVLWNWPYFWVCKVGIAGSLKARERQVDASAPGRDLIIWAVYVPLAYQVEQALHRLFAPFRVRFSGSGHTERFLSICAIPAILAITAWAALAWGSVALAAWAMITNLA